MEVELLTTLIDLGGQAVLLVILSQVWAELKAANQYTRDLLTKQAIADDERRELEVKVQRLEENQPIKTKPKRGLTDDDRTYN